MRSLPRSRAALAVVVAGLAATSVAQTAAQPFLTFEHEGLGSMLVDSRDLGLKNALAMLPARVGELPSEIEDMPPEAAGLLQLFLQTIARPARVAILYDGENPSGGFFGYGFVASVECEGEDEVNEVRDAVLGVAAMIAEENGAEIPLEPSERFEGMSEMMLPFGLLSFGPREADTGWRYEIVVGTVNDPDTVFANPPSLIDARGFESVATATMDFRAMTPLARIATNMAGAQAPQVGEFVTGFQEMGLVGDDAIRMDFQAGFTPGASVSRFVMRDAAAHAEALSLPREPLTKADLNAVPADAFGATIGRASFDSVEKMLDEMAENGLPVYDALDEFEGMTGVDLIEDVLHALGGTFAVYNAESTGGGSLLSMVAMMSVKDQEAFSGAMHKLSGVANGMLADSGEEGAKYVRLDSWTDSAGAELITLRFPGVPVPLELSFAFTDHWFIAAPTPQAAVAAARQAMGKGDDGLLGNPRFASMYKEHGEGSTGVSFVDTPRTIRDGYAILTLIGSGLSNLVRSPNDPGARDPGMILPLYRDLANDKAVPSVQFTRWEGEDLVTTGFADRSLWVQAGGEMGVASAALPLMLAGIGAAAAAGEEMNLGLGGFAPSPMALVEQARRSFYVDPVAELRATLTTSVAGLQRIEDRWPGAEAGTLGE
jgi:hypothetical protein